MGSTETILMFRFWACKSQCFLDPLAFRKPHISYFRMLYFEHNAIHGVTSRYIHIGGLQGTRGLGIVSIYVSVYR